MKFLGILSALFIAATAAPTQQNANQVNSVEMTGRQLEPLIDVLRVHGLGNALIVDPSITCTVSYTLALSRSLCLRLLGSPLGLANSSLRHYRPALHY